jgi:hypothetical protein
MTNRSGSEYGSLWRSTEFTTLNRAVVVPMPNAKVRTAIRVKPGSLVSVRMPNRTS